MTLWVSCPDHIINTASVAPTDLRMWCRLGGRVPVLLVSCVAMLASFTGRRDHAAGKKSPESKKGVSKIYKSRSCLSGPSGLLGNLQARPTCDVFKQASGPSRKRDAPRQLIPRLIPDFQSRDTSPFHMRPNDQRANDAASSSTTSTAQ